MTGAALGLDVPGRIGFALGLARALVGLAGAADGAAVSSIWSWAARDGFGTCAGTGAGTGAAGAAVGRALAFARGALLVRSRFGAE
jgi:hypothetical protein